MKKENSSQALLEAIKQKKDLDVYLDGTYYDTFTRKGNLYQGPFGCVRVEDILKVNNVSEAKIRYVPKEN